MSPAFQPSGRCLTEFAVAHRVPSRSPFQINEQTAGGYILRKLVAVETCPERGRQFRLAIAPFRVVQPEGIITRAALFVGMREFQFPLPRIAHGQEAHVTQVAAACSAQMGVGESH